MILVFGGSAVLLPLDMQMMYALLYPLDKRDANARQAA